MDANFVPQLKKYSLSIFAILFLIKLVLCLLPSDSIDMGGYKAWSEHLALKGFDDFYQTWHVVYGPAYLYLLGISGKIAAIFSLLGTKAHEVLIKLWSVLFDLGGGYLIYQIGRKQQKERWGFWMGVGYALNPAIIFNSSAWGQFESLLATMLLAIVYCLIIDRKVLAVLLFTTVILTKPQGAELLPLVVLLFFYRFVWRDLWLSVIGSLAVYTAIVVPFSVGRPFFWILEHYLKSGGDYPYATANGFNIWTIMKGQTVIDSQPFAGWNYAAWSLILVAVVLIVVIGLIWRQKYQPFWIYYGAYLLCFGVFLFGSRMHERYLFPALIFLTVAVIWERKLLPALIGLSLCHFGNTFYIYLRGWMEQTKITFLINIRDWLQTTQHAPMSVWAPVNDSIALGIAWGTLFIFGYSLYFLIQQFWNHPKLVDNK